MEIIWEFCEGDIFKTVYFDGDNMCWIFGSISKCSDGEYEEHLIKTLGLDGIE